ncbi:hypothetical protein VARIO8X_20381 [Burkholderiales bacterium 8X]|nr:hypothetical protein VARIO8X_20381 [Burkholderiales bacterium 8X]
MKDIERSGVDIRVALASHARQSRASKPLRAPDQPAASPFAGNPSTGLRGTVKRVLRRLAKTVFRLGRPFGRPLAFRTRAYFTAPIHAEFARLHEQLEKERQHHRIQQKKLEQSLSGQFDKLNRDLQRLRARLSAAPTFSSNQGVVDSSSMKAGSSPPHIVPGTAPQLPIKTNQPSVVICTQGGTIVCPAEDLRLLTMVLDSAGYSPTACQTVGRWLAMGGSLIDIGVQGWSDALQRVVARPKAEVGQSGVDLFRFTDDGQPIESQLDCVRLALASAPHIALLWPSRGEMSTAASITALADELGLRLATIEADTGSVRPIDLVDLRKQAPGQVCVLASPTCDLWKLAA